MRITSLRKRLDNLEAEIAQRPPPKPERPPIIEILNWISFHDRWNDLEFRKSSYELLLKRQDEIEALTHSDLTSLINRYLDNIFRLKHWKVGLHPAICTPETRVKLFFEPESVEVLNLPIILSDDGFYTLEEWSPEELARYQEIDKKTWNGSFYDSCRLTKEEKDESFILVGKLRRTTNKGQDLRPWHP